MLPWPLVGVFLLSHAVLSSCAFSLGERAFTTLPSSALADLSNMRDASKNLDASDPYSHLQKILIPRVGTYTNYLCLFFKPIDWRFSRHRKQHTCSKLHHFDAPQAQLAHRRGQFRGHDTIWPEKLYQRDCDEGPRRTKARCLGRSFRQQVLPFLPRESGMSIYFLSFSPHANLPIFLLVPLTHRVVVCWSNRLCRTMRHHARYRRNT